MIQQEIIKILIDNKMAIIMAVQAAIQYLIHSGAVYYVKPGKKTVKGFIKSLLMKKDEPQV